MSVPFPVGAQQRMCHSKRLYFSQVEAGAVAARRLASKRGLKLRAYQCPNCTFWHLTSKPLRAAP